MNKEKIEFILLTILVNQFNIAVNMFHWDMVLEDLNKDFIWLGVLEDLEKAINDKFSTTIPLIEHIDSSVNTSKDIVELITKTNRH